MLDPEGREDLMAVMRELLKNSLTIISITHDLTEIRLAIEHLCLKKENWASMTPKRGNWAEMTLNGINRMLP